MPKKKNTTYRPDTPKSSDAIRDAPAEEGPVERTRGYRDLIAWQKAMDLIPAVYRLTRSFPKAEQYALTSQTHRAVVSVAANIAEGQARRGQNEFAQHLSIARGSLAELDTLLLAAVKLEYLNSERLLTLDDQMIEVRKLIQGLLKKLTETKSL